MTPNSSTALTDADLDVLTRTIWGEARNQGLSGMVAIGHVVRNRVESPITWWGSTYRDVCLKPYQFSCWNRNDPQFPQMSGKEPIPTGELALCRAAATKAVYEDEDPTLGATHYYATSIAAPAWVHGATFTVQIGQHRFYKDVP